jgi:Uma2 family endonuclease
MDMEAPALMQRHRFDVDDYYRMAEAGILGPEDRVELIEGEIVEMPPIGSAHGATTDTLTARLLLAVGERAIVRVQGAIRLDPYSEPQPDLALLLPRPDRYRSSHPGPGEILLVVEVAHATVRFDREVKLPLYARAGIPECWIVDLRRNAIEVHSSPRGDSYRERQEIRSGGRLAPSAFPDAELDVGEVLGVPPQA